jgi:opacity protein-like surface antigen
MPDLRQPLPVVILACMAYAVQAKDMQLDVNLGWTGLDAGGNDEFKSGKALFVHYDYFLNNWLAADAGLYISDKTKEESREDIVGDYRTSIESQAILLGVKSRHRFASPYEVYARLGLQYWRTELEVEEYFAPGIPGGTDSATDTGYGYYASIGGGYYVTETVLVQLELTHMKQLDVFEGDTQFPFDLTINAFTFGVGYRF